MIFQGGRDPLSPPPPQDLCTVHEHTFKFCLNISLQIQKPIHFGQANVGRDTAIASRNLFCSASSPCNDITSKAIDDESHTVSHEALISFSLSNDGSKLQLLSIIISIGLGSDKKIFWTWDCNYFLIHQLNHVFWVLKRTVSMRRFFWVPTTYVLGEK